MGVPGGMPAPQPGAMPPFAAMPQPVGVPQQPQMPAVVFNAEDYQKAVQSGDMNELKQFVGTQIYHTLEPMYKDDTGKITGMLLERGDFGEIHNRYLQEPPFFWQQVREASKALKSAQQ